MEELKKNEIREVTIESWSSQGDGVARIDGEAVFVRGAIVGERCRARILKAGKTAAWAKVEELIDPAASRVAPDCPAYPRCGGCALRHMDYAEELRFKRRRVDDALARIGGLPLRTEAILAAPATEGWRNKAVFNVGERDGRPVTGFYRERSHDIVPVERCAIESDYANRAAAAVRRWMEENGVPAYDEKARRGVRRVFCRYGFASGEGQTVVVTGGGPLPEAALVRSLRAACPETVSVLRNVNESDGNVVLAGAFTVLYGAAEITDTLCGVRFTIAPQAFYQINRAQAETLYEQAAAFAALDGRKRVLDLYCGAGTITLRLAREAGEAVGVEVVEEAVRNARENAARAGIGNVRFLAGDAAAAAKQLAAEGFRPDVVTLDPPRKGLLPGTAETVAAMAPERVVYVSCDPATLARDVKQFAALGYEARRAVAVDMFPRTAHVETVVLMMRTDAGKG